MGSGEVIQRPFHLFQVEELMLFVLFSVRNQHLRSELEESRPGSRSWTSPAMPAGQASVTAAGRSSGCGHQSCWASWTRMARALQLCLQSPVHVAWSKRHRRGCRWHGPTLAGGGRALPCTVWLKQAEPLPHSLIAGRVRTTGISPLWNPHGYTNGSLSPRQVLQQGRGHRPKVTGIRQVTSEGLSNGTVYVQRL